MAQFWEVLRQNGSTIESVEILTGMDPDQVLPKSYLVHADLPLFYYSEQTPPEDYVDISDFPNLTPRFRNLFIERRMTWRTFGAPDEPLPSWQDSAWRHGFWVSGLLFEAVDLKSKRIDELPRIALLRERMRGVAGDGVYDEGLRWCLVAYLYSANPKHYVYEGPLVVWFIPIREDGSVQTNKFGSGASLTRQPVGDGFKTGSAQSAYADAAIVYLLPALFVLTTLNSPLTSLVADRECRIGPRGKTFDADTERLQDLLSSAGKAMEEGLVRAMLTCRQHFFRNGD